MSRAVAKCLTGKMGRLDSETETFVPTGGSFDDVSHSLRADGFDASEDGTGRGTPIVPAVAPVLTSNYGKQPDNSDTSAGPMLAVDLAQITSKANRSQPQPLSPTLNGKGDIIAIQDEATRGNPQSGPGGKGWRDDGASFTHQADHVQAVAFQAMTFRTDQEPEVAGIELAPTLDRGSPTGSGHIPGVLQPGMAVRRLTPEECEKLQGFEPGYTLVTYRKKPAADGPRYKALGNSMAVNCMRWIGMRIAAVERITNAAKAGAA